MEASVRFHGSNGSFHESSGSFHGSGGSFRDFHGSFHRFHGNFHFHQSWKPLPSKLETSVEVTSGSFRGGAQWKLPWKLPRNRIQSHWLSRTSIDYNLLPQPSGCVWKLPLLPWKRSLLPLLPLLPWKLHGSRFRGSKWALPRKLPRQLLFGLHYFHWSLFRFH